MKINRVGAIGEVYTDSVTGKMYKCTYSYKDSNGNVDCTWKEVGALPTNKIEDLKIESEKQSEKIPEGKISEKHSEPSEESASKASVTEIVEEKPVKEYPNNKPNKTRYTNYSKR